MSSPIRPFVLALLVVAVISAGACSSSKPEPKPKNQPLAEVLQQPPAPAPSSKDPCPKQLHDIGGSILLYYAVNKRLPSTLGELKPTPDANFTAVCPDSKKPYVYVPEGMTLPEVRGRVLVYDAEPTKGWRWTIIMPEVIPPNAPVVKVVAVPESRFATVPDK